MNFKKMKHLLSVVLSATMILSSNMTGLAAEIAADPTAPAEESQIQEPTEHEHQWQLVEDLKGIERYACMVEGCTETKNEVAPIADDAEQINPDENNTPADEVIGDNTPSDTPVENEDVPSTEEECSDHSNITAEKRKAPTCFTEGRAAYYRCENCHKIYRSRADAVADTNAVSEADLAISKLNHNAVLVEEKPESCTEDGYEAHYTCNICHRIYLTMEDVFHDTEEGATRLTEEQIAEKITITAPGHIYQKTEDNTADIELNGWDNFKPEDYDSETESDYGITAKRYCSSCTYSQDADKVTVTLVQPEDGSEYNCTAANGTEVKYAVKAVFNNEENNPSESKAPTDEVTVQKTKRVTGHSYAYKFNWPEDRNSVFKAVDGKLAIDENNKVTLSRKCAVCSEADENANVVDAELISEDIAVGDTLSCLPETKSFVASATFGTDDDAVTKNSEPVNLTLPTGEHALTEFVERKEATCEKPGNYEYFECENCHKKFWDEITPVGDNESTDIPALGHNIEAPVYAFEGTSDLVYATFSCRRAEGTNGCGVRVTKLVEAKDLNLESGTSDNTSAKCNATVNMTYDVSIKFDRNVVKQNPDTKQWYEDTDDPRYDADFIYGSGKVTREETVQHKFTDNGIVVAWAGTATTEEGSNYYNPNDGLKATLTCEICDGVAVIASEGATADTVPSEKTEIVLSDDAEITLGDLDTDPTHGYVAANCSTGGNDVYPVTITGTTADTACTAINITNKKLENKTKKSGHKYIITNLEKGAFDNTADSGKGAPTIASMHIDCAVGEDCPNKDTIGIDYTADTATSCGVTVTFTEITGTDAAGDLKQATCTQDGYRVWTVNVTIDNDNNRNAYKEYAQDGTGIPWIISEEADATGHDFDATLTDADWDWSDFGTEDASGNFTPSKKDGAKVYASYQCQNSNCGGEKDTTTETAGEGVDYVTLDGKRVKKVTANVTDNKSSLNDCSTNGNTVIYTATAGTDTDTKTRTVPGHDWNDVEWDDWTYVTDENGERTTKKVTLGTGENAVDFDIFVKTITASRTCSVCSAEEKFAENADSTVTPQIKGGITVKDQDTEANSCKRAGSTLYFATLEIEDANGGQPEIIKNMIPEIEVYKALGHNYEFQWSWKGKTAESDEEVSVTAENEAKITEYTSATAKKVCIRKDKEFATTEDGVAVTCNKTKNDISCENTDVFIYTAEAAFTDAEDDLYSEQKMVIHEGKGHDYTWTIMSWPNPDEEVTAGTYIVSEVKGTCKNNPTHIVSLSNVSVKVEEDGIVQNAATCMSGPTLEVSGSFEKEDDENKKYTGIATYQMPAGQKDDDAHLYTEAEPNWTTLKEVRRDDQNVTFEMNAIVKCDHASTNETHNKPNVQIVAVAPLSDIEKINCVKEYDINYTLSIKGQIGDNPDASLEGITIKGGNKHVDHHDIETHALSRVDAEAGSCNKPGWKAYYLCSKCDRTYSSYTGATEVPIEKIEPLGHLYGDPTFEWTKEGEAARAIYTCMRPGCITTTAGHTKVVDARVDTTPENIYKESHSTCKSALPKPVQGKWYYMVQVGEGDDIVDGDLVVVQPYADHKFENGKCKWCAQEGLVKVTFVYDNNGTSVEVSKLWVGEDDIVAPSAPNRPGYRFDGWSVDGENKSADLKKDIEDAAKLGKDFEVTALYSQITDEGTVTVKYKSGDSELDYAEPDNGDKYTGLVGKNVTVRAKEEIKVADESYVFSHWSNGSTTLSTNSNYDVYIASITPITIYAVYEKGTERPEAVPVVAVADIYKFTAPDNTNKLAFTTTMSIPEGYTFKESGILYSVNQSLAGKELAELNELIVLNASGMIKSTLNGTKTNLLSVKIPETKQDMNVFARGYLICKNADGVDEVYYSDSVYSTYNNAKVLE